jgi:rhodanese-related sulfurtransferase
MEQLIEFAGNHLILVSAWIFVGALLIMSLTKGSKDGIRSIGTVQATTLINKHDAAVLDIRAKDKFAKGHIAGSKNVSVSDVEKRVPHLVKDKNTPIVVVCDSGITAAGAAATIKKLGYQQLYKLNGGIGAWRQEQLPLVR